MSELTIAPDQAADLDYAVGDECTFTVTGKITSKSSDGGLTADVAVSEAETPGENTDEGGQEEAGAAPPEMPMKKKGPSAVMIMMGKGK